MNYDQSNLQLNALAGLVSLLPATDSKVFAIKGGNSQLASATISAANVSVHLNTTVSLVALLKDGRFQLIHSGTMKLDEFVESRSEQIETENTTFDAVIVAVPLELSSGLSFQGFDLPVIPTRKFQRTVTTLVKGKARPTFFGITNTDTMPYGTFDISI